MKKTEVYKMGLLIIGMLILAVAWILDRLDGWKYRCWVALGAIAGLIFMLLAVVLPGATYKEITDREDLRYVNEYVLTLDGDTCLYALSKFAEGVRASVTHQEGVTWEWIDSKEMVMEQTIHRAAATFWSLGISGDYTTYRFYVPAEEVYIIK